MKEISKDYIEEWLKLLEKNGIKSRTSSFKLPQGHIGNGLYRIADGVISGKAGWEAFQKELMRQGLKKIK